MVVGGSLAPLTANQNRIGEREATAHIAHAFPDERTGGRRRDGGTIDRMTKIPLVQCGASRIGLGRSVGGGGVAVAGGIATGRNAVERVGHTIGGRCGDPAMPQRVAVSTVDEAVGTVNLG